MVIVIVTLWGVVLSAQSEIVTQFVASCEQELSEVHPRKYLAFLLACGLTCEDISQEMCADPILIDEMSRLASVKDDVLRIQGRYLERSYAGRLRKSVPAAIEYAERLASGDIPNAKPELRWSASQWLMEKTAGKPSQEVKVTNEIGMAQVLEAVMKMRAARESGVLLPGRSPEKDVTPNEKTQSEIWLDSTFYGSLK